MLGGNKNVWLEITGDHSPGGFSALLDGKPVIITFKVFEYLLELITVFIEDRHGYLYNAQSISAGERKRDGTTNVDGTAHERIRHLKKVVQTRVRPGKKSYRLDPELGPLIVSPSLFTNPYINARILKKLKDAIEAHQRAYNGKTMTSIQYLPNLIDRGSLTP